MFKKILAAIALSCGLLKAQVVSTNKEVSFYWNWSPTNGFNLKNCHFQIFDSKTYKIIGVFKYDTDVITNGAVISFTNNVYVLRGDAIVEPKKYSLVVVAIDTQYSLYSDWSNTLNLPTVPRVSTNLYVKKAK